MEQGPVIIISFTTQQIIVARNPKGEIVEGDPVSINQHYIDMTMQYTVIFMAAKIDSFQMKTSLT